MGDAGGDADEVRFDRPANRHLAFGGGIHRCLGSHLARLELRVALREWPRRIPDYEIPAGTELTYSGLIRSVEHLPLVFPAGGVGAASEPGREPKEGAR